MVWWKREFAGVCGSCGCVSERRQDFFSKSGCGWWYAGRIFLQVFVVVACDMWCAQVWCAVRVFFIMFCPSVLGVDMLYNVVGYCVILVACAQILEMKCSNQPNGCGW